MMMPAKATHAGTAIAMKPRAIHSSTTTQRGVAVPSALLNPPGKSSSTAATGPFTSQPRTGWLPWHGSSDPTTAERRPRASQSRQKQSEVLSVRASWHILKQMNDASKLPVAEDRKWLISDLLPSGRIATSNRERNLTQYTALMKCAVIPRIRVEPS